MIFELACAVIVAMCAAVTVWCAVDTRRHRKRAEAAETRSQAAREEIGGQSGQWHR